ncbi:hypothetical protein WME90_16685 [Sorangium sp. So ce375]|uniref:hypothetical protein n=1 Tax=Sorangium sp. So ce375 TaxID=3133306 RepID=UPI003F5B1055
MTRARPGRIGLPAPALGEQPSSVCAGEALYAHRANHGFFAPEAAACAAVSEEARDPRSLAAPSCEALGASSNAANGSSRRSERSTAAQRVGVLGPSRWLRRA